MGLNQQKGNMYEFVTHTWNVIKGECYHGCSYCYMKRWGKQSNVRFDEKELKTDLGKGNFIFVGSSCDMFADNIHDDWISETLAHTCKFDNKYLLQTKNPYRYLGYEFNNNYILGATIETNRWYQKIMGSCPPLVERVDAMSEIKNKKFITIEPILDFDVDEFADMIITIRPNWVNIGADSGHNKLPEPTIDKIEALVAKIKLFGLKITIKRNFSRMW